ncbi:uncharacterized protein LOC34623226 [Cyclospora cayetanensis]|uniref:Uncharacterized protein LOC34623226 n=1 Tax=Cyclospora cayetanensis TaxID=88456 RepID=A0A6P6RY75_9EIME|nr:uncharacterized protein LOC34623226 [Cyclospora cayetanensis]
MQPPPGTPRCLEASAAAALSSTKSTQQRRQPGLPTPHRPSDQPTAAPGETPSDFVPACRTLCAVANVQAVQTGPTAAAVLPNGHDRSILCVDVHPSKKYCATGSADGGIRVFALPGGEAEGSLVCELYGASGGHSDWVTSCAYCEDGQLLSGGMDGKEQPTTPAAATAAAAAASVASVNAGRGGLLCGAPLDDCAGLVCAGAADGALYLLDMMAGQRGVQGGGPLSRQRVPSGAAACWGYGCSSRGAVQTVRTVEKMPSEGGDGIATTSAILAGGDDGHLACLELG